MKKMAIYSFLLTFLLFLPFSAMADQENKIFYFTLGGGAYFPQSSDLEDFDTGFNGKISLGCHIRQNFAMEIGLGYFETEAHFSGYDPIFGNWTEKDQIQTIPVTITAKGIYPIDPVELFILGGLGLYFVEGATDITTTTYDFTFRFDDRDTVFGFHLGLGGIVNITDNIFLGIEGKYFWADAEFEETILNVPVELEADLDGFTIVANIGFRF